MRFTSRCAGVAARIHIFKARENIRGALTGDVRHHIQPPAVAHPEHNSAPHPKPLPQLEAPGPAKQSAQSRPRAKIACFLMRACKTFSKSSARISRSRMNARSGLRRDRPSSRSVIQRRLSGVVSIGEFERGGGARQSCRSRFFARPPRSRLRRSIRNGPQASETPADQDLRQGIPSGGNPPRWPGFRRCFGLGFRHFHASQFRSAFSGKNYSTKRTAPDAACGETNWITARAVTWRMDIALAACR